MFICFECWSVFKDEVWSWPSPEEAKGAEQEAYETYGKKWGLSESLNKNYQPQENVLTIGDTAGRTIYPEQKCCTYPLCSHADEFLVP